MIIDLIMHSQIVGDIRWKAKKERKKTFELNAKSNHDLTGRFCCYWCSTLFNYNRYSCTGAFFDLIEWRYFFFFLISRDFFFRFVFMFNFLQVNYFSFLDIFGERKNFLGPQVPTGHCLYTISATFWFATIPLPERWRQVCRVEIACELHYWQFPQRRSRWNAL